MGKPKKRSNKLGYFPNLIKAIHKAKIHEFGTPGWDEVYHDAMVAWLPRSVHSICRIRHSDGSVREVTNRSLRDLQRLLTRLKAHDPSMVMDLLDQHQSITLTFPPEDHDPEPQRP